VLGAGLCLQPVGCAVFKDALGQAGGRLGLLRLALRGGERETKRMHLGGAATYWQSTRTRRGFVLPTGQVALLFLVPGTGLTLILATVHVGVLATVLVYLFVTTVGLQQCRSTQRKLADSKLRSLGYLWLVKLGLTLFLLYIGWIPQLDPSHSASWGYDPQRFYQDAFSLIESDWNLVGLMNYQGIIFYYGAMFYLFGHNPVIPALINAFVTLLGTLYMIRLAYEFKAERGPRDWTLALTLLIPEVVWYDVMTSRETLAAVLVMVATLAAGRYIVRTSRVSLAATLALSATGLFAILAVRTSMAIPVAVSIVLMALLLGPRKGVRLVPRILMIVLAVALLAAGPVIQKIMGGYQVDYVQILRDVKSFKDNIASQIVWSENSIGLLFAPNNAWQAVMFLPPRMVLYLVAPLTEVAVSVSDLLAGSWIAWELLMTAASSVLNILALPYALAGFAYAYKFRKQNPAPLVFHLSFWITFIAIAGGNIIIHERYRLMSTLLLYACAWLGYTSCTKSRVQRFAFPWYALLAAGAVLCIAYKML
jgi:hypothetical protein